jgi:small neutral amino acid transporter SnatA (MarC family)
MSGPLRRVAWAGLTLALLLVVTFGVVAPPERCPQVTAAELRHSAGSAVDWFVRNQRADGTWLYEYDRGRDAATPEYNEVRHAGVTMGLYQAAVAGLPGALASADRGTEWALDRLVRRDGWAALEYQGRVATGATALLAAGLAIRRDAAGDTRYEAELRRLGRFLVAQTERSGAVLAEYDPARDEPVPGEYSKYYTGEAYWALARLHLVFPDEEWGATADRIGRYLATSRDEEEGHFPPIPDHWAAYGMAETAEFRELSGDEVAYARRQAELFGIQARWLEQRFGPWGGVVRGPYVPRGGWYGVIDEAFTGWWLVAGEEPRLADLRAPIAERALCIAGLAVDAQSTSTEERVAGAWFIDDVTRMDDQQHALAGLLRTIPIAVEEAPDPGGPTAWLWAAVLLLALNPARAAFGIPRADPRAGDDPGWTGARVAAVGGAIGAFAVVVAAAFGAALLDALDVSDPSFALAAGLVALVTGAADLIRRPPRPEPALPGERAALAPVAFPLVARPALLVIALGADVLVAAGAMAVGVAALTALAAASPGSRALRWASRLLAAALLACGALLALDGLLDV